MNKIRCLLVDDEPPAIQLLQTYAGMIDQIEVIGSCHSAMKAFDMLDSHSVDLVFLDIQMPVLNGIDFIKTLKNPPAIVITTAYREFAIDGYDLDIIDYLLKPISFDRFLKSVDRYRMRSAGFAENLNDNANPEFIFFNVNRTLHKVNIDEIVYLESLKDYTRIHTVNSNLVVKGNIGSTLKCLPALKFLRIHRSFAVAIKAIQTFNKVSVNIGVENLPLGTSYKELVFDRLQ